MDKRFALILTRVGCFLTVLYYALQQYTLLPRCAMYESNTVIFILVLIA